MMRPRETNERATVTVALAMKEMTEKELHMGVATALGRRIGGSEMELKR